MVAGRVGFGLDTKCGKETGFGEIPHSPAAPQPSCLSAGARPATLHKQPSLSSIAPAKHIRRIPHTP